MSEFKVGDRVVFDGKYYKEIGVVKRITPKKGDIIVDFGKYESRFDKYGWRNPNDPWACSKIVHLTEETKKIVLDEIAIKKCKQLFDEKRNLITADVARGIIEILDKL